jgi:hypothetical protein
MQILLERGVKPTCPRCGAKDFGVVVEGYAAVFLQPADLNLRALRGRTFLRWRWFAETADSSANTH